MDKDNLWVHGYEFWIELFTNLSLCNPDFRLNLTDWKVPVPSYIYTGELGYPGPLYARLLAMTDNMLALVPCISSTCIGPSVGRILYAGTTDQYHGTRDAIYDVISIAYAGQTRV